MTDEQAVRERYPQATCDSRTATRGGRPVTEYRIRVNDPWERREWLGGWCLSPARAWDAAAKSEWCRVYSHPGMDD